ncbi:protocatechuate 3,4-dioxygenase beta subunit [Novosphingobium kunmingense]|uniref:Protocatechuate 3,4-dioxygenase beta subunit n=1 Tax=Novosphingobium kunmingense TaxID=1211806 RepID=A0A2N0I144_9SPHN|nr:protocatechuate 3,4-dioxygenase [Novosphingobium kunmingense]PKB24861.1 protocatechuate 3,4-dioxygenase beta subunit [Novosphingobium kunmingense]
MHTTDNLISRRAFAGSALAAATMAAASRAGGAVAELPQTPGQDIGPFYPVQHTLEVDADLTRVAGHGNRAKGTIVEITGRVLDRFGNPVSGARLDIWQCNAAGRYAHPNEVSKQPLDPGFQGFAKIATGKGGEWRMTTVKPGGYDSPIGFRTPHIHFDVSGRSHRLITQMYFPEDATTNAKDELYKAMGGAASHTVARVDGVARYTWDIVLMDG